MPATKVQLIGGNFQDSEGNVLALGSLKMRLSQDESITGVGQIGAGIVLTIDLDSGGAVSGSPVQSVWGNDQMTPLNSFYVVTGYDARGQLAWGPNNQQVIGDGGTFDVGTWIPNTVLSWTYPAAVGPTGPTGGSGTVGPPTPVQILGGTTLLNTVRMWKAIPNSGSLGNNIGFSPNPTFGSSSLIAATSEHTCENTYSTTGAGGNQVSICMTGVTGYGINPNAAQIYSTHTLLAAKWQTALVDLTNIRVWMVMSDVYVGNVSHLKADVPDISVIGFRYSTAAGDANWQAVCGTGGSQTVVDTGILADVALHAFGFAIGNGSVVFTIDGNTVATIFANIPLSTVRMGDVLSMDNIGLGNVKTIAINAFATVEVDFEFLVN